jgi:transcriptional regulator with XRE-family HTH domain
MARKTKKMNRETLADFVRRRRRDHHWSCQDIATRAKQKGFQISTTYIYRLENQEHHNPSTAKLIALAAGLDISPNEIFAIARGESINTPTGRQSSLLDMFDHLPPTKQDEILMILKCFYERYGKPIVLIMFFVGPLAHHAALAVVPSL